MAKKARPRKRTAAARRPSRAARSPKVTPIPPGWHTLTPSLVVRDANAAIEFYKKALGAKEISHRMTSPDGKSIWHAELKVGDSIFFVNDETPRGGARAPSADRPATSSMLLYVRDCESLYRRAVEAGAASTMPVAEMFWGDKMGSVVDPFGVPWMFATRVKKLSQKEMARAAEEAARTMSPGTEPEPHASESQEEKTF